MMKHNMSGTTEYKKWLWIKGVCNNKSHQNFPTYGARGVRMDEKWKNNFLAFYKDMGRCPEGHVLELIDLNGDFCKENCRWVPIHKKRAVKDMPNQNRKGYRRKLYEEPRRITFAVDKSFYDILQGMAIKRTKEEKKNISVNSIAKERLLNSFKFEKK